MSSWLTLAAGVAPFLVWLWLRRRRRADDDLGTVDMTNARRREIIDEEAKRWR